MINFLDRYAPEIYQAIAVLSLTACAIVGVIMYTHPDMDYFLSKGYTPVNNSMVMNLSEPKHTVILNNDGHTVECVVTRESGHALRFVTECISIN